MEAIDVGFLSVIPPLIAISLALITKDVISSIMLGIMSGTFIYAFNTGGNPITAIDYTFTIMAKEFNAMMIIFMCLLGSLVAVITIAGGSRAYGTWASKKVKTPTGAKLATSFLGAVIFIDDYFNCLTVGTVMRPVTDQHNISRVKLAYLIDAMAAPICIIAPVSSWAASVISYMSGTGLDGMSTFVATIPYNLYAILTIIMVFALSIFNLDFGPMARFERMKQKDGNGSKINIKNVELESDFARSEISEKGRVFDLIVPILALIVFSVLAMLYTGGYFKAGSQMTLFEGFGNTDATKSLVMGGFGALIVGLILFVSRKTLSFKSYMDGVVLGMKSMVTACVILTLAWAIKGVCTVLSTGPYVSQLVASSQMPVALIPVIIFIVAAILSFSIGTSWGTFGILIPIIVVICQHVAPEHLIISLSATLAGSIFGDHCSPISDTTILSSTGAACNHMDHVATQIPYAILVAICSLIGYLVAGYTKSLPITLVVSIALLLLSLKIIHMRDEKKNGKIA